MIRIGHLLLRQLAVLTGLVVALLLGLAWWGVVRAVDVQARAQAKAGLEHLDQELRSRLERTEHIGDSLASLWSRSLIEPGVDPLAGLKALSLIENEALLPTLVMATAHGPGEVVESQRGRRETQAIRIRNGRQESTARFWHRDGTLREQRGPIPTAVDPRSRPWYRMAAAALSGGWTPPYSYVAGTLGITYAVPVRNREGSLIGVVSVDLLLDDLSHLVWKAQPTPNSQAMISDAGGRAYILPELEDFKRPEARAQALLKPIGPAFLPLFHALHAASRQRNPNEDASFRFDFEGRHYYAHHRVLRGKAGIQWELSLAIPANDLLAEPKRQAAAVMALALLLMGVIVWQVRRLAEGVARPLAALAEASEALERGEVPDPPPTRIREVRQLGEAIQGAARKLLERQELEAELHHSQRVSTLGILAGGIAHDVKNQLTVIQGQLGIGEEISEPEARHLPYLRAATEAAHRCVQLVQSLLGFGRRSGTEMQAVDLNALVTETAGLLARLLGSRVTLVLELDSTLRPAWGDPLQLEQVIINLSLNARDAMADAGKLTLGTSATEEGMTLLWVRDTGFGMDRELQSRIFEPFFTTKDRGKGTGLGLTMVASIVKGHGGSIEVSSRVGEGTEVRVRLPLAEEAG